MRIMPWMTMPDATDLISGVDPLSCADENKARGQCPADDHDAPDKASPHGGPGAGGRHAASTLRPSLVLS